MSDEDVSVAETTMKTPDQTEQSMNSFAPLQSDHSGSNSDELVYESAGEDSSPLVASWNDSMVTENLDSPDVLQNPVAGILPTDEEWLWLDSGT